MYSVVPENKVIVEKCVSDHKAQKIHKKKFIHDKVWQKKSFSIFTKIRKFKFWKQVHGKGLRTDTP